MNISAVKGIRTLKNLLLFAAYVAALWGTSWYDLHYYGGTYNTVVTDVLLTCTFAVAFFFPIVVPQKPRKGVVTVISCAALAAAVLCLFVLRPQYTVSDGFQILSAAHYEDVQLNVAFSHADNVRNGNPLVSTGIVYQATLDGHDYELLFDPATGSYFDLA